MNKIKLSLYVSVAMPAIVTAANLLIYDPVGNKIGECVLDGAAIAQNTANVSVAGMVVTANATGDLVVAVDSSCNLGTSTNQAPSFAQNSPYDAGSVTVGTNLNIPLSASDPDGDPLTWTITSQPSGGLGTVSLSSTTGSTNTAVFAANNTAGGTSFSVQISDGKGGSADLTVNVTVTSTQLPASCTGINPGVAYDSGSWDLISGGTEYIPLEKNQTAANVGFLNGRYSYRQVANLVDGDAGHILVETSSSFGTAQKIFTISECPGDFGNSTATVVGTGCKWKGVTIGTLYYRTPGSTQLIGCLLDPNKTYYLNIVHAADENNISGTSTCPSTSCGMLLDTIEN